MSPTNHFALTIAILFYSVNAQPDNFGDANENKIQYPFVVSIANKGQQPLFNHFCTGIFITNRHVLTTAHCLQDKYESNVEILAGTHDLNSNIQKFSVKSWITYRNWALMENIEFDITVNDVAIITLDVLDTEIEYAYTLNSNAEKLHGTQVVLAGWGPLGSYDLVPTLQKIHLTIMTREKCLAMVGSLDPALKNMINHDGIICTSDPEVPLHGFSGGPILFENKYLVAIHMGRCPNDKCSVQVGIEAFINYYKNFINYAVTRVYSVKY